MQMVKAKCIMPAWDSPSCTEYKMGETYEIDRHGNLAQLKTNGGKTGKYVFEFDRNGTRTSDGVDVVKDYSCKECGQKFKTLNALGTHTRSEHPDEAEPDEEPAVVVKDGRGKKKGKTFTCKICGDVLPNLYSMGQHNKKNHAQIPESPAEIAVPA